MKNTAPINILNHHSVAKINKLQSTVNNNILKAVQDVVITEAPLLVSLTYYSSHSNLWQTFDLTLMMRTPDHDEELVYGLLFSERIINSSADITSITYFEDTDHKEGSSENHIEVILAKHVKIDKKKATRNFSSQSSCGICGKNSLRALALRTNFSIDNSINWLNKSDITKYGDQLTSMQPLFKQTGGVHGAGYISDNNWQCVYEDVGRHNAVDKVLGSLLKQSSFVARSILILSGRVSFELMQKAIVAGIPVVIAMGAPSSLAISAAQQFNITLIGFTQPYRFNVYSAQERIRLNNE